MHHAQANLVSGALFQGIFNWDTIGNLQYISEWLAMLITVVQQEKAASVPNEIKSEVLSVKLNFWDDRGDGERYLQSSQSNWLHQNLSVGFYLTSFIYIAQPLYSVSG